MKTIEENRKMCSNWYEEGRNDMKKDILELIEEGCGTKKFEGHYKCRKDNLCPRCEKLKQRIEGETAQNDIIFARQCMDFKMLRCDNKNCLNEFCPLQKSWNK